MPFLPGDGPGRIAGRGSVRKEGIQHLQAGDISPLAWPVRGREEKFELGLGGSTTVANVQGRMCRIGRIASTFFQSLLALFLTSAHFFFPRRAAGLASRRIASGTKTRAQSILYSLLASSITRLYRLLAVDSAVHLFNGGVEESEKALWQIFLRTPH